MQTLQNDSSYIEMHPSLKFAPYALFHFDLIVEPPSPPEITGLPKNQTLREGQPLSLTCASADGSPRPHLAWFVGDSVHELSHSNLTYRQSIAQSQLRLVASRQDNNRRYR